MPEIVIDAGQATKKLIASTSLTMSPLITTSYSVPYQLVQQEVEVRATAATVEIFHRGARVASHVRSHVPHRATTVAALSLG